MTTRQRCPGVEHRGSGWDRGGPYVQDSPLDDPDVRAEVWRVLAPIFAAARRGGNCILGVGTVAWWDGTDVEKLGGVANLALAYLIQDPLRAEAQALKQVSVAISQGDLGGWRRPSRSELAARRAQPGPMARTVDAAAARRWAATGATGATERAG